MNTGGRALELPRAGMLSRGWRWCVEAGMTRSATGTKGKDLRDRALVQEPNPSSPQLYAVTHPCSPSVSPSAGCPPPSSLGPPSPVRFCPFFPISKTSRLPFLPHKARCDSSKHYRWSKPPPLLMKVLTAFN